VVGLSAPFPRPQPAQPAAVDRHYRDLGWRGDGRIGWTLTAGAEQWGHWDALVFEGRRWSYRALWRWVTAVAHQLVDCGLEPGDRLLWQATNSVEALVLHLAGWRIGVCCVPVVPIYREHEMAHILRNAAPTAVAFSTQVGSRELAAEMADLLDQLDLAPRLRMALGGEVDGWSRLAAEPDRDAVVSDDGLPEPADPDQPCLLLYTSGTTAAPKGALHSSTTLLADSRRGCRGR